jgi:hypothetical protein
MMSIAVIASVCANTSEAALLVASFMQFSLDSGVSHHCPKACDSINFAGTPHDEYPL